MELATMSKEPSLETLRSDVASYKSTPRSRWRRLKLILRVRNLILISFAKRSTNVQGLLALTAADCRNSEIAITATPTSPEVTLDDYSHREEVALNIDQVSTENDNHQYDASSDLNLQLININKIIKEKDLPSLCEFGGAPGFAEALGTDLEKGIRANDQYFCCRQIITSKNSNLQSPKKTFLRSSNNYIIFLLLLSVILSIGFGIEEEGLRTGWFEGIIILNAVVILVVFPLIRDLLNDLLQLPKKQKLMEETEMEVRVVRGGTEKKIFISDLLLGDVICLKRGDQIPADGVFVSGDFIELDDGSKTIVNVANPFLFYGAEVINGKGRMLVTSVGENTAMSRVKPFEARLDKINTWKQIVGLVISIFISVVLFLRFELTKEQVESGIPDIRGKPTKVDKFMDVIKNIVNKPSGKISNFTNSLTMLLVGVVEGIPFCITLAIAYWNRRGVAFAQELSACVAMGSVTAICTDKTGELTLEPLQVNKFFIGENEMTEESVRDLNNVRKAICDGISTTIFIPHALRKTTDEPLLSWAVFKFQIKLETLRRYTTILEDKELSYDEEGRGVVMKKYGDNNPMFLHWRGLATTILPMCSLYYDNRDKIKSMDEQKMREFQQIVEQLESTHLKVIAFAYKRTFVPRIEETDLTLLGLVGLKSSIQEHIKESIRACGSAGVRIILFSGDDVENLKRIAEQFGILVTNPNEHKVIITGEEFRNLTDEERTQMVNRISVMGNSLPSDKRLLVDMLKKNGDSVAVIGIGTSDVPALKAADVRLAMRTWSTNIARASADIIIWDTSISFLLTMLRYGRCIYNNIQKYIQLELTMVVAGLLIASITISCTGNMPLTTIQFSWVNMVVVLCELALLIEPASEKLMEPPSERNESVITKAMWKSIFSQAIYQATILVTFQFKGKAILRINEKVNKTIIFNSFVLCQLFNQFNPKFNAIHKNHWFWVALGVTLVLQEIFVEIAHLLPGNPRLNWAQWCICFLIGMVPMAMDWAEKFILDFIKGFGPE